MNMLKGSGSVEIIKDKLSKLHGGQVLDVGTGRGDFIKLLSENLNGYHKIIGIDSHEEILNATKEKLDINNVELIKMDAENMGFEDECFDTVCLSNTLHHLSDKTKVIEEMKRVLKPRGIFIINEMFCDHQNEAQMSHVYIHHIGADIDMITGRMNHNYTYRKEEIKDIISSHGIEIIDAFEFKYSDEVSRNVEEHEEIYNAVDKKIENIKQSPRYEEIKKRFEDQKEWMNKHGLAGATQLMIIGRK